MPVNSSSSVGLVLGGIGKEAVEVQHQLGGGSGIALGHVEQVEALPVGGVDEELEVTGGRVHPRAARIDPSVRCKGGPR
jgi:hypothetical protein